MGVGGGREVDTDRAGSDRNLSPVSVSSDHILTTAPRVGLTALTDGQSTRPPALGPHGSP